mmetsp:Transcript_25332/g.25777  ORF Transcript_25332/g.25777 Transcript_25332/m.25777 type:complete len:114 (+) Transcript_25332:204-545(+)
MLIRTAIETIRQRTRHAVEQRPTDIRSFTLARDTFVPRAVPLSGLWTVTIPRALEMVHTGTHHTPQWFVGRDGFFGGDSLAGGDGPADASRTCVGNFAGCIVAFFGCFVVLWI